VEVAKALGMYPAMTSEWSQGKIYEQMTTNSACKTQSTEAMDKHSVKQNKLRDAVLLRVNVLPSSMQSDTNVQALITSDLSGTLSVRIFDRLNHKDGMKKNVASWLKQAFAAPRVTVNLVLDILEPGGTPQFTNNCGPVAFAAAKHMHESTNFMGIDLDKIILLKDCRNPQVAKYGMDSNVLWTKMYSGIEWANKDSPLLGISDVDSICMNILQDVVFRDGIRHWSNHGAPGIYVFATHSLAQSAELSHYVTIAVQWQSGSCLYARVNFMIVDV